MPPTVLDVEASGFGRGSYPVEVGFVLPDGSTYCTLIRPAVHWTHWDPAAEQVHRISRDCLVQRGRCLAEVAQDLNDKLRGQTVYSDAWTQDYVWLAALFEEADRVPSFRLEDLRALLTDEQARVWHAVKQDVSNELALQRHRASSDARLLQMTWERVRERVPTVRSA